MITVEMQINRKAVECISEYTDDVITTKFTEAHAVTNEDIITITYTIEAEND